MSWPDDKSERLAQLKRYRFVSGHFGYDLAAPLMADSYSFTFLRDPVDRVLSFYKFCLLEDMQKQFLAARIASEKGLDGFLNSREPEIVEMLDNQQTWQLANTYWYKDRQDMRHVSDTELLDMASSHLQQFSRVGLKETYDEDFRCILDDLAIKEELPVFKHHVTPDPVLRDSLKASTLETLRNRVELDEELYRKIVAERESFVSE